MIRSYQFSLAKSPSAERASRRPHRTLGLSARLAAVASAAGRNGGNGNEVADLGWQPSPDFFVRTKA